MRCPNGYQHVWNALACLPCLLVVLVGDMARPSIPSCHKEHPSVDWDTDAVKSLKPYETIVWIHVAVL